MSIFWKKAKKMKNQINNKQSKHPLKTLKHLYDITIDVEEPKAAKPLHADPEQKRHCSEFSDLSFIFAE